MGFPGSRSAERGSRGTPLGRILVGVILSVLFSSPTHVVAERAEPVNVSAAALAELPKAVSMRRPDVDLSAFAVAPGYRLEVDSVGYDLPTAIAMIPDPSPGASAPYYFVAELQGHIKVVTRDRAVHDFAAVPTWGRQGHDLDGNSQQGLAGLCLAPEHGYLFATFTEPDAGGVIRNRIVRFDSTPISYGLSPTNVTRLAPRISEFQSAPAHQIGDCIVEGDRLFVGVGDGGNPKLAADPDVLLGKVLCLTFDGRPCAGAPFGNGGPAAYVYALGFRNPFGLVWTDTGLHAVENGIDLDRFLSVSEGQDHLWNGTDEALASLADVIFPNPFAPVQLSYVEAGADYMEPAWSGAFVAAGYGSKHVPSGVAAFGGEPRPGALARPPRYLVEYLGPAGTQHFAGVAAGADGLFMTPMLPMAGAAGVVLRLVYDPDRAHSPVVTKSTGLFRSPELQNLTGLGCTGCHAIAGSGGGIGPNLDRFGLEWRLTKYLNSALYESSVAVLRAGAEAERGRALEAVLQASGEERTWVWVKELLLDPRFDDPQRQMPDLGLSEEQAEAARAELFAALGLRYETGPFENLGPRLLDNLRPLLAGAFAGALLLALLLFAIRQARTRNVGRATAGPPARVVDPKVTSTRHSI